MKMNHGQVFKYLLSKGFKYKGKSITERTVRTMFDNGYIKTEKCNCGLNRVADFKDVEGKLNESKRG